jgi:hypothetical protein
MSAYEEIENILLRDHKNLSDLTNLLNTVSKTNFDETILQQKLNDDSISYNTMCQIADILGYEVVLQPKLNSLQKKYNLLEVKNAWDITEKPLYALTIVVQLKNNTFVKITFENNYGVLPEIEPYTGLDPMELIKAVDELPEFLFESFGLKKICNQ